MNYLAHLYLSGPSEEIRVGNFIGDYVKGNNYNRYSQKIQKGILMHRQIDSFMDNHPITRQSASIFKTRYKRYSSVVIDIIYDHFLATSWNNYSDQTLHSFVSETHKTLLRNYFILPGKVKQFLPFLIKSRRLEHYKMKSGVETTLKIMSKHSSLPDHSKWAIKELDSNYTVLNEQFSIFFDQVMLMSQNYLSDILIQQQAI